MLDAPLVVGDIADSDLVRSVCREHGVDRLIHFAAYKNVGESMQLPAAYFRNNIAGTATPGRGGRRRGSAGGRVLLLVLGVRHARRRAGRRESSHPARECVRRDEGDERARAALVEVTSGVRSVSLRYFNAAGASADNAIGEDWTLSLNLVPIVMKATLGRRPAVQVFGDDYLTPDGTCIRDYIHVEDLADAHVRSIEHLLGGGTSTALNVGTGTGSSVLRRHPRHRANQRPNRAV